MIVTISGLPGSGKTSVARLLAKKLGFRFYSMGDIIQKFVLAKKMTLLQFNKLRNKDSSWDIMLDHYQVDLAKKEKNVVMDGIISFHVFPGSVKIFLGVKPEVGAMRIFKAKRSDEPYRSFSESLKAVRKRINDDRARYKRIYKVDCHNPANFDFVVDTSTLGVGEVVRAVLEFLNNYC